MGVEPGKGPSTAPITDADTSEPPSPEPAMAGSSATATSSAETSAQPVAAPPVSADDGAGRGSRGRTAAKVAVALGLIAAIALAGPWLLNRTLGWSFNWANPFQQEVIDQSGTPVLLSLQDLSSYHAASGYYELVIDQQVDVSNLPSFLAGERVLFVAAGTVDATVEFGAIGPDAVETSDDRTTATINLPGVTLAKPVLDLDRSYVADRDRGLTERLQDALGSGVGADLDMQQLYGEAERRLAEAGARTDDLVVRAEQNTRAMLTALLGELGFTQVTVNFGAPVTSPS